MYESQSHRTYETGQGRRRLAEIMSMTSDIKAETLDRVLRRELRRRCQI